MASKKSTSADKRFANSMAEARRLEQAMKDSGVDFFAYLSDWKNDESRWKNAGAGFTTFAQVLRHANLHKYGPRLELFEAYLRQSSIANLRVIGLDAGFTLVARIPEGQPDRQDPAKLAFHEAETVLLSFPDANQGQKPSVNTAKARIGEHYDPPEGPKTAVPSYQALFAENRQLKIEVERLKAENKRLVAKLQAMKTGPIPPGPKPRSRDRHANA